MKILLENWRDFQRGEGPVETERHLSAADNEHTEGEEFENQVANLAKELGVEISIERDDDGVLHIKAYGYDGSHSPWNGPDDEMVDRLDESVIEPFHVIKRDNKIKGKTHYVIIHKPSNMYVPSHLYKMDRKNVQGLANELNAYSSENEGLFESPELASDKAALKTILGIIKVSPYREEGIQF